MSIQIRLISDDVEELIAVSGQLGTCLGDRVEMNRLRDSHGAAGIMYGTWWPAPPAAPDLGARSLPLAPLRAGRPVPILVRLISTSLEELTLATEKLTACLAGQVEIHSARDSRNGEWIVYGIWTPAPALTVAPPEAARWPDSLAGVMASAYS